MKGTQVGERERRQGRGKRCSDVTTANIGEGGGRLPLVGVAIGGGIGSVHSSSSFTVQRAAAPAHGLPVFLGGLKHTRG